MWFFVRGSRRERTSVGKTQRLMEKEMDKGRNGQGKGVRAVVFVLTRRRRFRRRCLFVCFLSRFLSLPDFAQERRPASAPMPVPASSCLLRDAIRGRIRHRQRLR